MSFDRITAPFSPGQVQKLWQYQFGPWGDGTPSNPFPPQFHAFTCPYRDDGRHIDVGDLGILVPTIRGWICLCCDYTQDWAHAFMVAVDVGE